MKKVYLLIFMLVTGMISSCVPTVTTKKSKLKFEEKGNSENSPLASPVTLFQKAQRVLNNRCLSCHDGSVSTNWSVTSNSSESDWINNTSSGLIVTGDAQTSRIVKLMLYSAGGNMPVGSDKSSFTQGEYDDIVNWINSLPKKVSIAPNNNVHGVVFTQSEKTSLGDRNYVYKILKNIFGSNNIFVSNIRARLIPFGGPCPVGQGWNGNQCIILDNVFDMHGGSYLGAKDFLHSKHYITVDTATASAMMIPESSPVREGYRTYSCEKVIFSGTFNSNYSHPLFMAIKNIKKFEDVSAGRGVQNIDFNNYPTQGHTYTDKELIAAYRMFNNYRNPKTEEIVALKKIANQAKILNGVNNFPKRFEPWRYVIYSLCDNPGWQLK